MKTFTKTIEDFKCENCSTFVRGNGYTNHCPSCLWSKCVDISPGDRASDCMGMMHPVSATSTTITHKCETCGKIKNQKISDNDCTDMIINISVNPDLP
ncbi:MAG: RNHCP domain-containing protein [Alphaproteobacteria bacterium]|nr:RNHCP domain-containing protein [Alphaproteobacteria bacterium]